MPVTNGCGPDSPETRDNEEVVAVQCVGLGPLATLEITVIDLAWLQALANGYEVKELRGASAQGIKNRLVKLRKKFKAGTNIQMVANAIRWKVIQ